MPTASLTGRSRWGALGDDFVPVGGLLAGKLASHAALGALLGAVGASVRLSVHVTAWAANLTSSTVSTPALAATSTVADGHQTVSIEATSDGYSPATIHAQPGVPTTLRIHSDGAQGCVRAFTMPDLNLQQILPASGDTNLDLGTLRPGTLAYACGMGMYAGTIIVN